MKKRLIMVIATLLGVFSFSISSLAAAHSVACSDSYSVCTGIEFTSFGTDEATSDPIYIPYGVVVKVDGQTYSNSMFTMSFYAVDSNGKMVSPFIVGAGPFGGMDYGEYRNTVAGWYRIRAVCGDGSTQERCTGLGMLNYYR